MKSEIITISGPSGVGKSFLIDKILNRYSNIHEIAGVTTRPIRVGEIDGQSSHFYSLDYFNKLEKEGKLLLVKEFFGNKYAWLKKDLVNGDELRIMNISYKSIRELKEDGLRIFSIFIRPHSQNVLEKMLKNRISTEDELRKRLRDYQESEMFLEKYHKDFDMIYINDYNSKSMDNFVEHIFDFINGEKNDLDIMELIKQSDSLDKKISVADEMIQNMKKNDMEEIDFGRENIY